MFLIESLNKIIVKPLPNETFTPFIQYEYQPFLYNRNMLYLPAIWALGSVKFPSCSEYFI